MVSQKVKQKENIIFLCTYSWKKLTAVIKIQIEYELKNNIGV